MPLLFTTACISQRQIKPNFTTVIYARVTAPLEQWAV